MSEIKAKLSELDVTAEQYVWEKSRRMDASKQDILKAIGISSAKFYTDYTPEQRESFDMLAREIFQDNQFRALKAMDSVAEAAAQHLIKLMKNAKSEYVQMQTAQTLLAYALGTPTQRLDVTSGGQQLKLYSTVSPDDWDDDSDD